MTQSSSEPLRSGIKPGYPVQRNGPSSPQQGSTPSNNQAAGNSEPARVPAPSNSGQSSGVAPGGTVQRDGPSSPQLGFTPSNSPPRVPQVGCNSSSQSGFPASTALLSGGFPKISSNFDKVEGNTRKMAAQKTGEAAAQLGFQQPNLGSHDLQQHTDKAQTAQQSFADIAARKTAKPPDLFAHSLSAINPVKGDDGVMVIMPQQLYDLRISLYQFALIGRILLPPGSSPRSSEDYKAELSKLFQTTGDWKLLHLGKGFFSLQFRLQADQLRAARHKSWRLSAGSINLREWQPYFDPYKESSSTTQIWVRLFHLPTEFWHPEFLVGIFRSVGNVIKLDGNTAQGLVGHFARALVEVDLSKPLLESVRVGLLDNLFSVDFSYENVPLFCSFCHYIGHSVDQCRKAKVTPDVEDGDDKGKHHTAPARKKKIWVEIDGAQQQNKRIVPVGIVVEKVQAEQKKVETSNSFDALENLDNGDETIPETQHVAGDIMDMVTGSSVSEELKKQLLKDARECSMNRQLRLERESAAAQQDVSAADSSSSGEEVETAQPSSTTPPSVNSPTAPPPSDQFEAAGKDPSIQEAVLPSSSSVPEDDAADLHSDPTTGGTGKPNSPPNIPSEFQSETTSNKLVDPPPAKSTNRRTKNKRKVTETLPKRQLRSSTRNKSISKVTPEMIEAYARNQCYYVPGDSLGQPKDKQVAPNSPHPKQLEDQLRAAAALGRHTSAYILDTGQRGGLKSMDFIANQQWGDIPRSEAYTDSDINSD